MKARWKHLILAVFSLGLLASTLYIPQKTENREALSNLKFGYPLPFIGQDLMTCGEGVFYNTKNNALPTYNNLSIRNKDCKIRSFSVWKFLASFLSIFFLMELFIFIVEYLDFRIRSSMFKE